MPATGTLVDEVVEPLLAVAAPGTLLGYAAGAARSPDVSKEGAHFLDEERRLLKRRKVSTSFEFDVVTQIAEPLLKPHALRPDLGPRVCSKPRAQTVDRPQHTHVVMLA
jgi:hypothetical protein